MKREPLSAERQHLIIQEALLEAMQKLVLQGALDTYGAIGPHVNPIMREVYLRVGNIWLESVETLDPEVTPRAQRATTNLPSPARERDVSRVIRAVESFTFRGDAAGNSDTSGPYREQN